MTSSNTPLEAGQPTSRAPRLVRPARPAGAVPAPVRLPATDPESDRITGLVQRLRAQWTRSGADIATRLRPGVDDARLDAVERQLGLLLPRGARAWWRAIDGVDPVRTAYRTSAPSVGPGGWVPLTLEEALRRASGQGPGLAAPPALLPLFARDEELIAVRLGSSRAVAEQIVLADDGEGYQHSWRVGLDELLGAWADSLLAAVIWLPDAHDWVSDPFAMQALPRRELVE
ncbi:hypothetical protein [Kineococcus rhizosphaerae]|uniref:Knr4/Smi1-like domain-containing protein n=1 Tax=Kineococcus rhizosphaerae TaxID=559628 RepID=A0A2T0R9I7_9ACTN|nr:hypothetical protein [Kineococcus rhizosphaerae]PRY17829.1 hypothetical protein CLV37_10165 [Kineococcus rhizosphaerae]